jgi:hypothetical protein
MDYNFTKFENTHGRYEARITITASNSIGFPTKFYNENNIDNHKYIVLYFDEEKKAIGIQFSNDDNEPHKFTIIKSKDGYGGSVVATSFFKKHGIDPKAHKGKYDWKKVETPFGELFVFELKKE